MILTSSQQMRQHEQITINELGIPANELMFNAAAQIAKHCFRYLEPIKDPKVLIVCGPGNNGGDGKVLAALLINKKINTCVIDVSDNLDALSGISDYDLVVDAILGTGLTRNLEGNYKLLTEAINRYAKYVISVDVPSGVSDSGRIMGCAVKAHETITLGFPKTGLYLYPGAEYAGVIHIEDIGIPQSLIGRIKINVNTLTDTEAKALLPARKQRSNKGDYGKVLVFAGSNEMPGAAALTCSAAYKTGCGLVNACVLPRVASVIHHWQREVITRIVQEKNGKYFKNSLETLTDDIKNADVIVIGPGIGRSSDVTAFVHELISITQCPLILDADALFAVAQDVSILKSNKAPCVITPHPGEMNRLTGLGVADILDDISNVALKFSSDNNVVTLLKDAHTVIANPNGDVYINTTGNNALSKAGTGDVLTGMISGFIAQGTDTFTSAALGAYFHGKACEAACLNKSMYSITASDIIDHIPVVMKT